MFMIIYSIIEIGDDYSRGNLVEKNYRAKCKINNQYIIFQGGIVVFFVGVLCALSDLKKIINLF